MSSDHHRLIEARDKLAAHQLAPGFYTWTALEQCLAAAKAFAAYINELAKGRAA